MTAYGANQRHSGISGRKQTWIFHCYLLHIPASSFLVSLSSCLLYSCFGISLLTCLLSAGVLSLYLLTSCFGFFFFFPRVYNFITSYTECTQRVAQKSVSCIHINAIVSGVCIVYDYCRVIFPANNLLPLMTKPTRELVVNLSARILDSQDFFCQAHRCGAFYRTIQ